MASRRGKTVRVRIVVGCVLVFAILGAGIWWLRRPPERTLRRAIADAFNRPVELIELNIPPAAARYPGTILTEVNPSQLVVYRSGMQTDVTKGPPTSVSAKADGSASASVVAELLGAAAAGGSLDVDVDVTDLRVLEIPVNKELKDALIADSFLSENVVVWKPRVVVRAYEGIVTLNLRRGASLSAEAWEKAKKKIAEAKLQSDGSMKYASPEATIIAFETLDLQFFSRSAGPTPDDVKLIEHQVAVTPADVAALTPDPRTLGFATIATTHQGTNRPLRMVDGSLALVQQSLTDLGAVPLGVDILDPNQADLDGAAQRIVEAAKQKKVAAIIVYYVGHTYNDAAKVHYVELGTFNSKIASQIERRVTPMLLPSGTISDGSAWSSLLEVAAAANDEATEPHDGLFPLGRLVRSFEKQTSIPIAFVVDGCFQKDEVDELRKQLSLTPRGDYFGPSGDGGPAEVSRLADALNEFSSPPYLRGTNVVLLGAAPGTLAVEQPSPRGSWTGETTVGPLAARLDRVAHLPPYESWGELLRAMRDIGTTGERRIYGTVSWSDFSKFDQLLLHH